MDARTVDEAAARLNELRRTERDDLAASLLAFAAAAVAARLAPTLALPALAGGIGVLLLAARAYLRRSEMVGRLAADRDAYTIREVSRLGERAAATKSRRSLAASIRSMRSQPGVALADRVNARWEEFELLAEQLERPNLVLDPFAAVACRRLLSDGTESPLFNPELPLETLSDRLRQIRAGFAPRDATERERSAGRPIRSDAPLS